MGTHCTISFVRGPLRSLIFICQRLLIILDLYLTDKWLTPWFWMLCFKLWERRGKYSVLSTLPIIHIVYFDLVKIYCVKQISARTLIKRADMTLSVVLNFSNIKGLSSSTEQHCQLSWAQPPCSGSTLSLWKMAFLSFCSCRMSEFWLGLISWLLCHLCNLCQASS